MPPTPSQHRLERLIEVNRLISSTLDTSELLSTILSTIRDLFDVEGCSLLTVEPETGDILFHTIEGGSDNLKQVRLKPGQGIVGWVVSNRQSVLVNEVAKDPRFYSDLDRQVGFQTQSILCAPMEFRGRVVGAIEAINSRNSSGFQAEDLRLLEALASQAAVALRNAQTLANVQLEKEAYRQELGNQFRAIVGESKSLKEVIDIAQRAARTKSTVLIRGESGTGKEIFARAIHKWSPRAEQPLMVVNTVALSPELLESELFGHEKGAFTGAIAQKKGKFELAEGGSVFLDEIGDIGPDIQTKLLRVLQEHEFQRVGGTKDISADIRVIAATNRPLEKAVAEGKFREDLYYRLNVVSIHLPPLRERRDDVTPLARHFIRKTCRDLGVPEIEISDGALKKLQGYEWPGNVRQLANLIERAVVLARGEVLVEEDFPIEVGGASVGAEDPLENLPLSEAVDEFKARLVRRALMLERGNQTRAAKRLGLRQPNLSRLMRTLGIASTEKGSNSGED
ncbi:MAG: sigma 54-interacting transcriptional regulator [Candidatus Omnitrophica bacterium]|nr:Nitrogen fixation protein VnfA [bacterium]NUN96441.1 sigma 54-interacting transcriptional regulator [Candidatus Omnitrophota bacterium]